MAAVAVLICGAAAAGPASADDNNPGKADTPGQEPDNGSSSYNLREGQNSPRRPWEDVVRDRSAPLTAAQLEEAKKQAAESGAPMYNPNDPENPTLKPPPLTAADGS